MTPSADLRSRCEPLRSLHCPAPLPLPNAWDVATTEDNWDAMARFKEHLASLTE